VRPANGALEQPMRRLTLFFLPLLIALCVTFTPHALAQGTLDQSQTATPNAVAILPTDFGVAFAQTFTAGRTGLLDSAALQVGASDPGTTGTLAIYAASGGEPIGTALATGTMQIPQTPTPDPTTFPFVTVFFSPGVNVTTGTQYAMVLSDVLGPAISDYGGAVVGTNPDGPYAGGEFLISVGGAAGPWIAAPPIDLDFETFVSTKTPQSVTFGQFNAVLTVAVKGCGSTTPSGSFGVNPGSSVPVLAVPCPGSVFSGWTGGPCAGTTINPCDIAPTQNLTITANFTP
jgi:uncharacterized repeat protein (TIGR02543 family)